MPETARNNDAHGRQQLKLITAVGVVILVGFAGVVAWQQWPTGGGHLEPDLKPLPWLGPPHSSLSLCAAYAAPERHEVARALKAETRSSAA